MANPRLPGISETEETLLYAKLNEYNRGRISFKEAGAYLIVLPRSGHSNYSLWVYSPEPEKQSILFIHDLSPDIYEALRMASTMFYFSKRCLLIVDYNLKRMQSNGDDLIPFGKYRGHYLHEILKVDPAYLSWSLISTPQNPQAGTFCRNCQSLSFGTSGSDATKSQTETGSRTIFRKYRRESNRSHFESSQSKDRRRPYKTRMNGTTVLFYVRQIVTLADPSVNRVVIRLFQAKAQAKNRVKCQLPNANTK